MLLPVGGFDKPAIRRMAAGFGLRVADKKDSQEICFVTRDRYDDFIRRRRAIEKTTSTRPARSSPPTARSSASTPASKASPSASARASAWRSASGSSSCASKPETRRVVIGDRDELNRRELTARDNCNWLDDGHSRRREQYAPHHAASPKSATTPRPSPPP